MSREFKNFYKDFSASESDNICIKSKELNEHFAGKIELKIKDFLRDLENEYEKDINWSDVSVYTGTAGIGLMYFHLSENFKDEYFSKAVFYLEKSVKRLRKKHVSFLCGDPGVLTLCIIMYKHIGNTSKVKEYLKDLFNFLPEVLSPSSNIPNELLFGRAGYLYCLLLLKQAGIEEISDHLIKNVVQIIISLGEEFSKLKGYEIPLMYEWHGKEYFGAAHGIAGILFMLLQGKIYLTTEFRNKIQLTIDFIATLVLPSGNYPSSKGNDSDRLVQWCHGAPGFVHLFCAAYKIFNEIKYLNTAIELSNVVWKRGLLKKGYGICHGVAGNAYCFLVLYIVTNDIKHLHRACKYAEFCLDYGKHDCRIPDRPFSLFEGLAGTIYFLSDILHLQSARFPGYDIQTWNIPFFK